MVNSLVISTGNAVLVTTLGFLACYALSRFDLGGRESIFFWTITNRMARSRTSGEYFGDIFF